MWEEGGGIVNGALMKGWLFGDAIRFCEWRSGGNKARVSWEERGARKG
jgi:hypothetical protein